MSRYLKNELSEEEKDELWLYVIDPEFSPRVKELIPDAVTPVEPEFQLNQERQQIVLEHIFSSVEQQYKPSKNTKMPQWRVISTVAASVMIFFGTWFLISFFGNRKTETIAEHNALHDVAPGNFNATLILSNGKKVSLSDASSGDLAKESGILIRKSKDGQLVYEITKSANDANNINQLSTKNGETFKIELCDGTLVWLNSASSIKYRPQLIHGGKRMIELTGEAYFQVAKDQEHPFVVRSNDQEVEVLGTHFNINSYPDEKASTTTLVEGSVRLKNAFQNRLLVPGYQAINQNGKISVSPANIDNVIDWTNNDFSLNRVDFRTAMRKISRWYDVEVIYDDDVPANLETGGWISREKSLLSVLKFIESSGLVHFRLEKKKVYVSK